MGWVQELVNADGLWNVRLGFFPSGYPCVVALGADSGSAVYYAYKDDAGWHSETIAKGGHSLYDELALTVDSAGVPHVFVYGAKTSAPYNTAMFHFARVGGGWGEVTSWADEAGSTMCNPGTTPSLCAVGTEVYACVSVWRQSIANGVWANDGRELRIYPGSGGDGTPVTNSYLSLAVPTYHYSHNCHLGRTPGGELSVLWNKWTGSVWELHATYAGADSVLLTDGTYANPPAHVYPDAGRGDTVGGAYLDSYGLGGTVQIATHDGGWSISDTGLGYWSDWGLAIDASDYPCVAQSPDGQHIYYNRFDGSNWIPETVIDGLSGLDVVKLAYGIRGPGILYTAGNSIFYAYRSKAFSFWSGF